MYCHFNDQCSPGVCVQEIMGVSNSNPMPMPTLGGLEVVYDSLGGIKSLVCTKMSNKEIACITSHGDPLRKAQITFIAVI